MKTSVFLPLVMEYDDDVGDWEKSFGVTAKDKHALMTAIARKHCELPEEAYVTNILMESIKEMSPGMILYLASRGAWKMWKKYGDSAVLAIRAEEETRKAAEE